MIDYLRRILTADDGPLARCSRCRLLWPLYELENGLCPECQEDDDDE